MGKRHCTRACTTSCFCHCLKNENKLVCVYINDKNWFVRKICEIGIHTKQKESNFFNKLDSGNAEKTGQRDTVSLKKFTLYTI